MGEYKVLCDADTGGWRSGEVTSGTSSGQDGWFELLSASGASEYRASGGFADFGDAALCFASRSVGVFQVSFVDGLQAYL